MGGDQGRAAAEEGIVYEVAGFAVVADRSGHTLNRLLGAVAAWHILLVLRTSHRLKTGNIPNSRLVAGTCPACCIAVPHGIPTGFVLKVIVASGNDKVWLSPDDLRAHFKIGFKQAL